MTDPNLTLMVVGHVESPLMERALAPKQGIEGVPDARLVFQSWVREALADVKAGDDLVVLTWLDRADRRALRVHPRGDAARPMQGVFSTRSPDRPNPIGLHRVQVVSVLDELQLVVRGLEALHGTPIVDVKPVLRTPHDCCARCARGGSAKE